MFLLSNYNKLIQAILSELLFDNSFGTFFISKFIETLIRISVLDCKYHLQKYIEYLQ